VTNVGDADSMLRFWLERGDDGMKHCWKMKRIQRARLSMGRKRDTALRCGDVGRRRGGTVGGGEREETTPVGMTRILLCRKMKKTHAVDSAATNGR
jgi:hypothetical protein